jgi:hypothetical protein
MSEPYATTQDQPAATQTAPSGAMLAPEGEQPPPIGDPVLMDTLAQLDRDVDGETRFCLQAAEALRAFQARWSNDVAVDDGYGRAIQALDNMRSILAGADVRWSEELTRKVRTRQEAERRQAYAQVEREHAVTWADQPPPAPPQPEEPAPVPPGERSTEPPPEAGVVA